MSRVGTGSTYSGTDTQRFQSDPLWIQIHLKSYVTRRDGQTKISCHNPTLESCPLWIQRYLKYLGGYIGINNPRFRNVPGGLKVHLKGFEINIAHYLAYLPLIIRKSTPEHPQLTG